MFFTYHQNNSGGSFAVGDSVAHTVIIEAKTAEQADSKAQEIGIYFNGCEEEIDCPCCGDRWTTACEGTTTPLIYSTPAEEYYENWGKVGEVYCYIYMADGTVKKLIKE